MWKVAIHDKSYCMNLFYKFKKFCSQLISIYLGCNGENYFKLSIKVREFILT